jgi:hypothetical protein
MMRVGRGCAWPLFVWWTLISLGLLMVVVLNPRDLRWYVSLLASIAGAAFYYPRPVTARIRKTITVDRPIDDVWDFLSQPANQPIWNRRSGPPSPSQVPIEVGQEWTQPSKRGWVPVSPLKQRFSKLDRPQRIEIEASGHGISARYGYELRDLGGGTEILLEAAVAGMPAFVAWLTPISSRLFGGRDLDRLKRALESRAEG